MHEIASQHMRAQTNLKTILTKRSVINSYVFHTLKFKFKKKLLRSNNKLMTKGLQTHFLWKLSFSTIKQNNRLIKIVSLTYLSEIISVRFIIHPYPRLWLEHVTWMITHKNNSHSMWRQVSLADLCWKYYHF